MYTLSIENAKGNSIRLSQNPNYTITNITGLNPPSANINTAVNANFDGATFKSSRLNTRNIVITMKIEGAAETNRIALYNFIKAKQACKLYFKNETRDVYISGYVESMQIGIFDKKEVVQVSIICPNPYFIDVTNAKNTFSSIINLFQFPFAIEEEGIPFSSIDIEGTVNVINSGDIDTGMLIEFAATGEVVNPALYKISTSEFIKLNTTMQAGDVIQVNTEKGQKSVVKVSGGVKTNILNVLDSASTWLTLDSGDNVMTFTATTGAVYLSCSVSHNDLYEGV